MIKRFYILLLAIVASVGMSWATTTDLASISDDYTAQDGEILTGTLGVNVKISIADGATVTLLNANINGDKTWTTGEYAGLTCLGDATITIVGTNSVSGFSVDNGYPGIYVPSGKTLIINGTGSLTAQSSTEEAAGIGAGRTTHCGNIEIQSGKITAIAGGEEGAGIGGAFNADCGNITISGGIVTAVGGYLGAGIGGGKRSSSTDAGHCGNILISGGVVSATSGAQAAAIGGGRGNNNAYKSNCGTITITNTALKVYAHQGGSSTNTIGAGKYNNCGTVTIGGNTGVINDDPYTYRTKEDGEIVVVYINAIGTVVYTQECKDKIDIARELYDALEDSQKGLVTNYQTLLDAEAAYAALIPAAPATDPIVIPTNTEQSSYTQGDITITCSKPGDFSGFYLDKSENETATITNSGSSTISQIVLGIGWFPDDRSYVRANGAEPTISSDPYSITFSNVNSNNVTLTITNGKIQISDVTITLADEGGSTPTTWTSLSVGDVIKVGDKIEVPAEGDGSWGINGNVLRNAWGPYTLIRADLYQASESADPVVYEDANGAFYVFKAENSSFYPFSNVAKGGALVVTGTSDGLEVTAAENKEFTVAVHEGGGSTPTAPAWLLPGDEWDETTKTLTVNSNPGSKAYYQNTEIEHVIFGDAVTSIGEMSFWGCSNMTTAEIGNSVQTIENNAFRESGLVTVTIGNGLTSIDYFAFCNCESLATLTCEAVDPPTLGGTGAFTGTYNLLDIYVPAGSVDAYKSAWTEKSSYIKAIGSGGGSTPTTWTSLQVGDVIKVGDKIEVPNEGDGWGINGNVLKNAWGPYTLIRADLYQASESADPVVYEDANGAFYVFKAENSSFYPLSNIAKGGALVVTGTSDGLEVTAAENKEFTVAVHEDAAPANQLYMEVDGTAGTLKWGLAGSNPVYDGDVIQYDNRKDITTLTIDESCQNHTLTSFYNLFYSFSGLTTINGLENLATANVESMRYMFYYCKALTSLDLSSFNTANVTDMKGMFNGCSNLTTIYVGDGWNTSAVTDGYAMFYGCTNLPNYDSEATGVDKAYVGAGGYLSAKLTPADVMALISAIGEVEYTAESKAKIDAARAAYDGLSESDQALVTNYSTLTAAETAYANAKTAADQAAAAPVIALINQLPNPMTATDVKLSVYTKVQDARAAFDALTADQKLLVTNIAILEAAEAAFAPYVGGGGAPLPDGALSGAFSINASGGKIVFSKGNLQYVGSWQFATNQWDAFATDQSDDHRDLFGWGTKNNPNNVSTENSDYTWAEWGENAISNGGDQANAGWRTLTNDEWTFLLNTRSAATRFAKAYLFGTTHGLILFPDNYSHPAGLAEIAGINSTASASWNGNQYSAADWTKMEAAGAVFLPLTGYRNGTSISEETEAGEYWTSTPSPSNTEFSYYLYFSDAYLSTYTYGNRVGYAVRLVISADAAGGSAIDDAKAALALINAIPDPVVYPDSKPAIDAARAALDALSDEAKSLFVEADTIKLPNAEAEYAQKLAEAVAEVVAKIAALPDTPLTEENTKLSVYDKVEEARAAYDALTAEEKAAVTNIDKLEAIEAAFAAIGGGGGLPTGALTGAFSVGESSAICFSQGNLQATTADLGANWTWSFAEHQWDFIGNAVANTAISDNKSVSTNGTVDMFGWSTAATYYGIFNNPGGAYYTGDFIDWGTNAISNGGNTANAWHTLAHDEWDYLFNTRTTTSGIRYAKATVNGIPGIILLPDDWSATYYALSNTNDYEVDYNSNVITTSDWTNSLEANGAVFLPAAGERLGADVNEVGSKGHYWSSTFKTDYNAYCLSFNSYNLDASDYINRREGYSVRLVVAAPVNHIAEAQAALALINAIPTPAEMTPECLNAVKAAREAVDALGEAASLLDASDLQKLTDAEAIFVDVLNVWISGDCRVILWKDSTMNVQKLPGDGNGAMADYSYVSRAPWYNSHWYSPEPGQIVVTSLTIEEGVTSLTEDAFGWMDGLKTVTIPASVTSIHRDAFYWSKAIDDIYLTADTANLTWGDHGDTSFKPEKATRCHVPADLLTAYQEKFGTLNMTFVGDLDPITPLTPEQQQALDAVKGLINAIPSPVVYTPACKDAIDAARAAYDALTPDMLKQLVSNYNVLTAAEAAYEKAKADTEAAAPVIALINELPNPMTDADLKLSVYDKLVPASDAFNALTDDQKALVTNADVLAAVKAAFDAIGGGGGPAFSVNASGDVVVFAPGNLQATLASSTWTWSFAANQWDIIGNAAGNTSVNGNGTLSADGTVDLFGWVGNSSTVLTDGMAQNGISNSQTVEDYGNVAVEALKSDWSTFANANSLGGRTDWRLLTNDEWAYIINTRSATYRYCKATVNNVIGLVIFPDGYTHPSGVAAIQDANNTKSSYASNVWTAENWALMATAGATFLPAGGNRVGEKVYNVDNSGRYWTSASHPQSAASAYGIEFSYLGSTSGNVRVYGLPRYYGASIRLAAPAVVSPIAQAQAAVALINAIPSPVTLDSKDAIEAARAAVDALGENAKLIDAADMAKLTDAEQALKDLNQAEADKVIAKIDSIPQPVTLKLATRDSIESARAAFDALTADQKALVTNYPVLTAAEATWAGLINVAPAGALSGKYTINAGGDVIYFAHGNLQYTRENLDADWSTGTFRLAENQYDMIEEKANPYCTDNYGDKTAVGLFGWGTWGEGKTPNLTSHDLSLYTWTTDFVGTLEGTNTWRTLSKDEWSYLLTHNNLTFATVHGVHGLLVAPNDSDFIAKSLDSYETVTVSDADWTAMEAAGVLFLPAAGQRYKGNATANILTGDQGEEVLYYSSTEYDANKAYNIWYKPGTTDYQLPDDYSGKRQAFGVRLVSAGVNPLDQVQVVKDLIDAIPVPVTLDDACVNAIQAARAGYDALDTDAKAILDAADVKKLTDAEQALKDLNQAEADKVIAKINNIPLPVELKLATRDSIESARAAYEALNAAQQELVSNYQTLLDAEAALAALNPGGSIPMDIVWDGNTGIANVSPTTTSPAYEGMTVTVGQGSSFSTYQSRLYFTFNSQPNGGFIFANENGTNITKVVIESTTALTSTMTEVDRMGSGWVISNENKTATWTGNADSVSIWKGEHFANYWVVDTITFTVNGVGATPLDSAQHVKDLIDAIPTPVECPTSGPAIAAALVAYNQLSDAAKGALDDADVQKMTDAATQYAALDAIAAIEAIPDEIVYDPAVKAAIETAREKYDALIDASKALVPEDKVHKLTNAEEAWAILAAKIEHNVSYIGKDGELKHETVALFHIPDPAPELNGFEFDEWRVKAADDFLKEGLRIQASYTPIITTDPEAYDTLVYNGTAQTLITAGVAKEGHIEYRLNDGEWSTELPKATMASANVVYYKLVREGHEDYLADSIVALIAKAPVVYTAPVAVDSLVYNAANQTLIAAGQTQHGTFEYSLEPTLPDSWSNELPQVMGAGTYNVYYRVQGDLNHKDSTAVDPIAVTIAKAELTATADDKNVIYGDNVPAYTVTYAGWQGEDTVTVLQGEIAFACNYVPTSNVGEYAITPSGVSAENYTINFVDGKVIVAKALLTVTADNKTVTYGDAAPAFTATYSGFKNNDSASVVSNLAFICEYAVTSNVGKYTITPDSATALNYTFAYVSDTLTVNQAALMITAENKNVVYGDSVPTYTATYSGWKNSDDASVVSNLAYTCEYAPTSNVDEYTITPSGATALNYAISYTNGKVTVAKADLMITADDKNVIYGDAAPAYTATYSGWKNSDDASVVSNLAYTCEYAPTSNVGEYTIIPSGASAQNYTISYTNGKVTVAQATLTVTAENKTVTYGDAAPAFTATYSGFKNNDDASVVNNLAYICDYAVTSNVGKYTITPDSATALNYTFAYVSDTLTVNQAALMITAEDKNVIYGDSVPEYTATYSGWKNSDDASVVSGLAYTCEYAPTSNVGEYTITPNSATAQNYAISYTNGKLTVGKADLMITADDKNVIYGDAVPTYTASYSGWKNDDNASVVDSLIFTCEYTVTSNIGEYTITPSNAVAQNYAISYTNGKVTVSKAVLTITANDTVMIYGDEAPAFTASYSGWLNGDDETLVSGLAFTTPYQPGSPIGTYTINPNSATALNYQITFVDGKLTVNKAVVSVSGAKVHEAKFADGHAGAEVTNGGQLNGVKLNDAVSHVTTASFSSAEVSEHLTITLFYELTGDAALLNNYDLQPTSEIFTTEGVIIEPFHPDTAHTPEEGEQVEVEEGIDVYAYGYCDGSGYSLKYHLNSGNPNQYKIDFDDSRFDDIDWTNLTNAGKDGTIEIEIPVDMPTGDYTMTVYFRDSRFTWLESQALSVTFHVNLPETFVQPLFNNVIALVDTCHCLTDIQWYYRANSSEPWKAIPGATGHYYRPENGAKLEGEYFVSAKMDGVPTYTCGQSDMETLYGEPEKPKAQVHAYPNPVVNTTNVTIEGSTEWNHSLRIVNMMGVEVENTTFEGNETSVEMSTYPQGNYMISVDGIVVKVMKQ